MVLTQGKGIGRGIQATRQLGHLLRQNVKALPTHCLIEDALPQTVNEEMILIGGTVDNAQGTLPQLHWLSELIEESGDVIKTGIQFLHLSHLTILTEHLFEDFHLHFGHIKALLQVLNVVGHLESVLGGAAGIAQRQTEAFHALTEDEATRQVKQ